MLINDLYQTKIRCTKGTSNSNYYNVRVDANDVIVTVTLIDFNNNPVSGKNVNLSVDKGYFTKLNGKSLGGTSFKSVKAVTNSWGQISATYTASERGLCTFSANNTSIKIDVTGWKNVDPNNEDVWTSLAQEGITKQKCYTNGEYVALYLVGNVYTESSATMYIGELPDDDYAPNYHTYTLCTNSQEVRIYVRSDGNILLYSKADPKQIFGVLMCYPLKATLTL